MLSEDEEPDSLHQATFTIPCAPKGKRKWQEHSKQHEDNFFPILKQYEQTTIPAHARHELFQEQVRVLHTARRDVCLRLFKQVSESITHSFNSASPALSPFLANLERSAIKVLALHGSQLSALLEDHVKDLFESFSNTHVVSLESYECTSLVTVLRLLTLRAHSYCSEQDIPPYLGSLESGDPRLLRAINFTLVIYVGSVERFHTGIFNELIQALNNLKDGRCPEVILVVPLQAGTEALDSKLDTSSLPLIDISSVQICENPVSAFESFLEELYNKKEGEQGTAPCLLPGPRLLEHLAHIFFEKNASLDEMVSILEIGLYHYYTSQPLSSLARLHRPHDVVHYTEDFFIRLRDVAYGDKASIQLLLRDLSPHASREILELVHSEMSDNVAMLQAYPAAIRRANRSTRLFYSCAQIISRVRKWLVGSVNTPGAAVRQHVAPRRTEMGGILYWLQLGKTPRSLLQDLGVTLRRRPLSECCDLTEDIRSLHGQTAIGGFDDATRADFVDAAQSLLDLVPSGKGGSEEPDGDEEVREKERLFRVQQRLQLEEVSTSLKNKVTKTLYAGLDELLRPLDPFAKVLSQFDDHTHIVSLLDPAPRANILVALNDYQAYLKDGRNLPDICRAYQTYHDAGRFINLADWYEAFKQTLLPSPPRADEKWSKDDTVQLRFALAVHELGKMGFLKRTRRKPDHVLKLIHDLPPSKVPI